MSLTVARQNVQIRAVSRPIRLKARTATKGHHTEQKRERDTESAKEKEGKGRSEECRRGVMSYHVSLGDSGNYTTVYKIILSGIPDVA